MEDGRRHKIAFVIQARMKSERLPGKILIPIPLANGKPLLQWIVDELRRSAYDADIFVATSENKENDVLESFCEEQNIQCFRGDEEDVLSRFMSIAKQNTYGTLVRLTADNPIVDIKLLDETIDHHLENEVDYTNTTGLPVGMNFEIMTAAAIASLENENLAMADKEHVTLFFKNNDQYKKMSHALEVAPELKSLRLTVDYPSDLLVASTVLSFYNASENQAGITLVEKIYNTYSFVFQVNESNFQKKQFANEQQEFTFAKDLLRSLELLYTVSILEKNEKKNTI